MMTGKMFNRLVLATISAGLVALRPLDTQAAVTYDTRAMTGDHAPGTEPGVVFNDSYGFGTFNFPVINNAGQVAFHANLTNVTNGNFTGIWSGGMGSLGLVTREGNAAPDTGVDIVFSGFNSPLLNDAGQTAFIGTLASPFISGANGHGIWSGETGSLSVVARAGNAAPGTNPGAVYRSLIFNPVFNGAGQTAFKGQLTGTGVNTTNDYGIWSEGSGSLSLIAREGNAAPGTDPGVVYRRFGSNALRGTGRPVLNDAGQAAFKGELTGTGVDTTNDFGIWSEGSGSLALVAREGNAAPGTDPGVVFSLLDTPVLNNAGQIIFKGRLTGTGVITGNQGNFSGIWAGETGSLSLVARMGDAAPGTEPGTVFGLSDSFDGDPVLNSAGQVAFVATLTGSGSSNNSGIWSGDPGSLALVARKGNAAPGTDPGVVFSLLDTPVLNNAGQLAFIGRDTGGGIGAWATDLDGVLNLIFRIGDLFDINDDPQIDDLRTISNFSILGNSGSDDGRGTSFNDAGQLAFGLNFTDGSSGIFVASIQADLAGDLNGDGFVGVDDLNIILINWNQNVTPGNLGSGDPSGEGFVGVDDLNIVLVNWNNGTSPANGATIPEPGTLTLLCLSGAGLLGRKQRGAKPCHVS